MCVQGQETWRSAFLLPKLEVVIGVVLEQEEIVVAAELIDLLPPFRREERSRWVRSRRIDVKNLTMGIVLKKFFESRMISFLNIFSF